MNVTTPVETSSGASGSPVVEPGNAPAGTVAPVVPPVAPAKASSPVPAKSEPAKPLEFSPGVAELTPAERRAAFLAASKKPDGAAPKVEPDEDTDTTTKPDDSTTTETKPEEVKTPETEEELVDGLAKHAKEHPELKGLLKRTEKVLKQNSERKAEIDRLQAEHDALKARPVNVLAPDTDHPLSHLTTVAEVEAEVTAMVTQANTFIKWLAKHEDAGGIWDQGGPNELTMTPKQVASAMTYYEKVRDGEAQKLGNERKAYLAQYAETLKALDGVKAEELENPKLREGEFLKRVPEMRRDPAFLQLLADAKAGRELREEQAQGVTRVKVQPGKVTAAPKAKDSDETPRAEQASTKPDPATLRSQNGQGDGDARAAIRAAFVRKVA